MLTANILAHCANEPIQFLGHIQAHGFVLVASCKNYKIQFCSANITELIPDKSIPDILHSKLQKLLPAPAYAEAVQVAQASQIEKPYYFNWDLPFASNNPLGYSVRIVKNGQEFLFIEFEPNTIENHDAGFHLTFMSDVTRQLEQIHTIKQLTHFMAQKIQEVTGYHRVMCYQFHQDWHGEVLAETSLDRKLKYLGLHFPASDIPAQARALYAKNTIRFIANVEDIPAPLIGLKTEANTLDLLFCALRSVSPIHIEYLKNMDVYNSMSISVLVEGKLWGLIACHHPRQLYISSEIRHLCEILGRIFSQRLTILTTQHKKQENENLLQVYHQLIEQASKDLNIVDGLIFNRPSLLDLCPCSGAVLYYESHIYSKGKTPEQAQIQGIIDWIGERPLVMTNHIAEHIPSLSDNPLVCGVMAIHFGHGNYIIWIREEVVQQINWAGNPHLKNISYKSDSQIQVHPRASFDVWTETVSRTALQWTEEEKNIAQKLRLALLDFLLKVSLKVQNLNDALIQKNEELQFSKEQIEETNTLQANFLSNIGNELKSPIRSLIEQFKLLQGKSVSRPEEIEHYLKLANKNNHRLLNLVEDILKLAKLNINDTIYLKVYDMGVILHDLISLLKTSALRKGVKLIFEEPAHQTEAYIDKNLFAQAIHHILDNAIKFTEGGEVIVSLEESDDEVAITIQDTGIGIEEEFIDKIFRAFAQESTFIKEKYGGVGLGLTISKYMFSRLNAKIEVTSLKDVGSIFYIRLPKVVVNNDWTHSNYSCLIIEDNEINALVLGKYLERLKVDFAYSMENTFSKIKHRAYDIILIDIHLDDNILYSTNVIQKVKRKHEHTKFIAMIGGYLSKEDRRNLTKIGFDSILARPIVKAKLLSTIQSLLSM